MESEQVEKYMLEKLIPMIKDASRKALVMGVFLGLVIGVILSVALVGLGVALRSFN